ncbi:MAG: hypothetical protein ACI87E_001398, partial [Mariniblastus sp.]
WKMPSLHWIPINCTRDSPNTHHFNGSLTPRVSELRMKIHPGIH